jgi:hypothetical protein
LRGDWFTTLGLSIRAATESRWSDNQLLLELAWQRPEQGVGTLFKHLRRLGHGCINAARHKHAVVWTSYQLERGSNKQIYSSQVGAAGQMRNAGIEAAKLRQAAAVIAAVGREICASASNVLIKPRFESRRGRQFLSVFFYVIAQSRT